MSDVLIRKMEQADLKTVLKIEQASFSAPWPKKIFAHELNNNNYAHYFVLIFKEQIVGFAGLWIVMDDAQVTNIAIDPDFRRRQFGEKLFNYILHYAVGENVVRFSLEVRVSNIAAQKMYRKYGLVPGGMRKNYYVDNKEDALIMWVNLQ
ncbi:MAG TPA: ribosomal protein S18-alanine N-acetyltransferase [Bacillota bacterium]|nr:ribosomal protein S18-alanine N-acetyltransferase [Bacillota bacterium]